jgi:hypothetical protein
MLIIEKLRDVQRVRRKNDVATTGRPLEARSVPFLSELTLLGICGIYELGNRFCKGTER